MPATPLNHRQAKSWRKITVQVPVALEEVVGSFLASLTGSGVETVSSPVGSSAPALETIIGYLDNDPAAQEKLILFQEFLADLGIAPPPDGKEPAIALETIAEEDWDANWKEHFKPFAPTPRLVIKPSWEAYTAKPTEVVIEMDPGMAFGTGLHASTQLALQLIEKLYPQPSPPEHPRTVLDVGTGTGILGMACALFGATQVIGLDNDIDARVAATENLLRNRLEKTMSIGEGALAEQAGPFDLVIANITHNTLIELAPDLVRCTKLGGALVLAGILAGEQGENIQKVYSQLGFTTTASEGKGEWVAFSFRKIRG